jgi:hypothetical protein
LKMALISDDLPEFDRPTKSSSFSFLKSVLSSWIC